MSQQSKQMTYASTMLPIEYSVTEQALKELRKQYKDLLALTTVQGDPDLYEQVKEAANRMRNYRLKVEDERKLQKASALEHGRKVDEAAKDVQVKIAELEEPLAALKKAEDDRIKAEKEAKILAEQARVKKIEDEIVEIRELGLNLNDMTVSQLTSQLKIATDISTEYRFEEYEKDAQAALDASINNIRSAIIVRGQKDKEERERKEETKRLAAEREKLDQEKAELNRQKREMAEQQAQRNREAAAEAAERDKQAAVAEATRKAEEKVRQDAIAAEQKRKDDAEKDAAEKARQEELRPAREKLERMATELLKAYDALRPKTDNEIAEEVLAVSRDRVLDICNYINLASAKLA